MAKSKALVSDELWAVVEPLLPRRRRNPKGGRPWVEDRAALNGILFVLTTGIGWERLPQELGYGAGVTCWRWLRARAPARGGAGVRAARAPGRT